MVRRAPSSSPPSATDGGVIAAATSPLGGDVDVDVDVEAGGGNWGEELAEEQQEKHGQLAAKSLQIEAGVGGGRRHVGPDDPPQLRGHT
jgi:hypothetical protein